MNFKSSTQQKHWQFAVGQVNALRSAQRAQGALALQAKRGGGDTSPSLPLSAEEELSLQRFYEAILLHFCIKELELPVRVAYVAVAFFKRVVLRHSLCAVACGAACDELTRAHRDHDPLGCVALTCVYIAAKTEEYRRFDTGVIVRRANAEASVWRRWREKVMAEVGVESAAGGGGETVSHANASPCAITAAAIFKREMVVLSSIGFHLTVHDPFKAALALVQTVVAGKGEGEGEGEGGHGGCGDGETKFAADALPSPVRALHAKVQAALSSSVLTDAGLEYAPAQLAAAAVQRALKTADGAKAAGSSSSSFFALLASTLPAGLAETEAKGMERALSAAALALEEGERRAVESRSWLGGEAKEQAGDGNMVTFAGYVKRCGESLASVLVAEATAAAAAATAAAGAGAGTSVGGGSAAASGDKSRRVRAHDFDSSDDEM